MTTHPKDGDGGGHLRAVVRSSELAAPGVAVAREAADAVMAGVDDPLRGGGRMMGRYGARLRLAMRFSTALSLRGTPPQAPCRPAPQPLA